jgi:hypothetical protein
MYNHGPSIIAQLISGDSTALQKHNCFTFRDVKDQSNDPQCSAVYLDLV